MQSRDQEADGLVYSGCYVNARIELWAQDNANGKRVNAKLPRHPVRP